MKPNNRIHSWVDDHLNDFNSKDHFRSYDLYSRKAKILNWLVLGTAAIVIPGGFAVVIHIVIKFMNLEL